MNPPTIYETHEAKRIYLEGMAAHYPDLDPRLVLLGVKEDGVTFETKGYGWKLVQTYTSADVMFVICAVALGVFILWAWK